MIWGGYSLEAPFGRFVFLICQLAGRCRPLLGMIEITYIYLARPTFLCLVGCVFRFLESNDML